MNEPVTGFVDGRQGGVSVSRKIGTLTDPKAQFHSVDLSGVQQMGQQVDKYVDANLEQIQKNVFSGYQALSDLQTMQDMTKSADTVARIKMGQMRGEGKSYLGDVISTLGKTMVDGYTGFTQAQNQRLEIEADIQNKKLTAEQKQKAEELKAYYDEKTETFLSGIDNAFTQGQAAVQQYGWEKGATVGYNEAMKILNSPEYQALPAEQRGKIRNYFNDTFKEVRSKQTNVIVDGAEQVKNAEVDKNTTFLLMSSAQTFSDIESGRNTGEAVKNYFKAEDDLYNKLKEANGGQELDQLTWYNIIKPARQELYKRVQNSSDTQYKNSQEARDFAELDQLGANLEQVMLNGGTDDQGNPITEASILQRLDIEARRRGLQGYDYSNRPISNEQISENQIKQAERTQKAEQLAQQAEPPLDPNSPEMKTALGAAQGSILYEAVNNVPGSKAQIADIKNRPEKQSQALRNVPALLDEFNQDRKEFLDLQNKMRQLEQSAYSAGRGADEGNADSVRGQQDSITRQIEELKAQQLELVSKWRTYGLNLANPGDRSLLDKMNAEADASGANAVIDKQPLPTTTTSKPTYVAPDASVLNRATNNASRKNRPEWYDDNQAKRDKRDISSIQRTQESIIKSTGDTKLGEFVANSSLKQLDGLDKYEALVRQGMSPDAAAQQVIKEYNDSLYKDFKDAESTFTGEYKAGVITPEQHKATLLDSFKNKVNQMNRSTKYYIEQFGGSTRPAEAPKQANFNQSTQPPSDNTVYSNQASTSSVSPTKPRAVGQTSQQSASSFATSNDNLVMPVAAGNSATYTPVSGNGGNRPSGIRVSSSSNQVLTIQGGRVVHTGKNADGNFILIKTPDGRYENYSGLEQLYWKKGDYVQAGRQVAKSGGGFKDPDNDGRVWVGTSGNTGNSSGAHLDIRGKNADGTKMSQERLDQLLSNVYSGDTNKSLAEQRNRTTSGYGPRKAPVRGASTNHLAYDFGLADGTKVYIDKSMIVSVTSRGVDKTGGGGNVVDVKLTTGETIQLLHMNSTDTGDAKPGGFTFSVFDKNPLVNGEIQSQGSDPRQYLMTVAPSTPNTNGQSNLNGTNAPVRMTSGMYELSPGVYLFPNNTVLDTKTGQVRTYQGEKKGKYYPPRQIGGNTNSQGGIPATPGTPQAQPGSKPTPLIDNGLAPSKVASTSKSYVRIVNSGRKAQNGQDLVQVRLYENGKMVHAYEAVTGGLDGTVAMPAGIRVIGDTYNSDVADTGGVFTNTSAQGKDDSARGLGFHYDAGQRGTHGCIGFTREEDAKAFQEWSRRNKGALIDIDYNQVPKDNQPTQMTNPNTGAKSVVQNQRKASIYKSDYVVAGKVANSDTENYGYSLLAKDAEFRKELVKTANELGIPAVWLADLMAHESANFTYAKRANQWGYYGLIQINSDWLRRNGLSHAQLNKMSLAEQMRRVVAPYLKQVSKETGRKYETVEDLVAGVWGGGGLLKKSVEARRRVKDGLSGTSWNTYMNSMGQNAGRRYNHNYDDVPQERKPVHDRPRGGCPTCQQMQNTKSFRPHQAP